MSRLKSRRIAKNRNEMYEKTFEDRGVKEVEQFATPSFKNPSQEDIDRIPNIFGPIDSGFLLKIHGRPKIVVGNRQIE